MKEQIISLLKEGLPYSRITQIVGCDKSTISYHAKKLGLSRSTGASKFDWFKIQSYYDSGHSIQECFSRFRVSNGSWVQAVKSGRIKTVPKVLPLGDILRESTTPNRNSLKRRLIKAGIFNNLCAECGLTEWRGSPITLQLHHHNGKSDDNRVENLTLLCPNCHSQTETFSGRNKSKILRVHPKEG